MRRSLFFADFPSNSLSVLPIAEKPESCYNALARTRKAVYMTEMIGVIMLVLSLIQTVVAVLSYLSRR